MAREECSEFPCSLHAGAARSRDPEGSVAGTGSELSAEGGNTAPCAALPPGCTHGRSESCRKPPGRAVLPISTKSITSKEASGTKEQTHSHPGLSCPGTGCDTGDRRAFPIEALVSADRERGGGKGVTVCRRCVEPPITKQAMQPDWRAQGEGKELPTAPLVCLALQ